MPTNTYAGHSQNVVSLESLITFCTNHEARYNPVNAAITIRALAIKKDKSSLILQQYKAATTLYNNATNQREIEFAELKKLCTRALGALTVCGATPQTIDDAKTHNRKIQGRKKSTKKTDPTEEDPTETETTGTPAPEEPKHHSTQQSYSAQIDHFSSFIQTLEGEALYTPHEPELTVLELTIKLKQLQDATTGVIQALSKLNIAKAERQTTLYDPKTGLVALALEVKQYIKSVFGATSPEYKEVNSFSFHSRQA